LERRSKRGPRIRTGIPKSEWVGICQYSKSGSLRIGLGFIPIWGPTHTPIAGYGPEQNAQIYNEASRQRSTLLRVNLPTCTRKYLLWLGCAFRPNSVGFQRKWDKSHRPARNGPGTSTGMCYNTILDIPVRSGWHLSNRFLHVEKARTYSK
jgi:hypothetical protein